ncbi:hypothetical protein [Streptomyces youssoufiensis]
MSGPLDWRDSQHFDRGESRPFTKPTRLRSHHGEPAHKARAEPWIATERRQLPTEVSMRHTDRDVDHALAYPEPPASPLWHRHAARVRPLTPAQQRRNRELLAIRPRTRAA